MRLRCVLVEYRFVDILRECRSTNEELCRSRTHDSRENCRHDDTCRERREEIVRHDHEYLFDICARKLRRNIDTADHTDENCRRERDDDPRHSNVRCTFDLACRIDRHEANEDMRLTEITKTPCQGRDDSDRACRCAVHHERIEELGERSRKRRHRRVDTAERPYSRRRNSDDRAEHHDALNEVRPAYCHKTADERIRYDEHCAQDESHRVIHAPDRREQLAACDETARRIEKEEDQDEDRRDHTKRDAVIVETILHIVGKRE